MIDDSISKLLHFMKGNPVESSNPSIVSNMKAKMIFFKEKNSDQLCFAASIYSPENCSD